MEKVVKIIKRGKFCHTLGDDSIVMHCLTNYKVLERENKLGFPLSVIDKVTNNLKENNVSYEIYLNKELSESYYAKENMYDSFLKKGFEKLDIQRRLERIKDKLNRMSDKEIKKIIRLIEEELDNA